MTESGALRDLFAAERTLPAWNRTWVSLLASGFALLSMRRHRGVPRAPGARPATTSASTRGSTRGSASSVSA